MIVRPGVVQAKKAPVGLILGIVAVLVVGGGVGWYFCTRPGPARTVNDFLSASERNDSVGVRATLSAASLKLVGTSGASRGNLGLPPGSSYSIGSVKIEGEKATVPVKFKQAATSGAPGAGTGTPQEFEVPFAVVKEEGEWKVDLMGTVMGAFGAAMGEVTKGMGDAMGNAFGNGPGGGGGQFGGRRGGRMRGG